MFDQLVKRENEIFDIIEKLSKKNLDFIVVGGYAVSAFKHRFSMDADLVISSNDLAKFEIALKENGFKKIISKQLENIYKSKFVRYQKGKEFSVSINLMVDGIAARQIDASFSFQLLAENSEKQKIVGTEREVAVKIPKKEILIALKLHSGRLTDFRDVVALSKNINVDGIKKLLLRGNKEVVRENLKKFCSAVETENFINSFKGVFMEKVFDIDMEEVKKICNIKI